MAKKRRTAVEVKAGLKGKPKIEQEPMGLSTGSTLVNLSCTGRSDIGFLGGHYYFFVGDSNSGKTFLGLSCLAEASINSAFDKHRLIYDDVEDGALMDIIKFFGQRVADRLEPPAVDDDGFPSFSRTAEDFYFHLDDAQKDGRSFIYLLDSQDSLSSDYEEKKFNQNKRKKRKIETEEDEGKSSGSYGDNKAKVHSANLRKAVGNLKGTNNILIVLNQTRDSFDMFTPSTYSGGRALTFYATLQMWSSKKGLIQKQIRGKKRQLGIFSKVQVKKNRITGRDRSVVVPIYHSFGIDEVGSCVDYLVDEGVWKKKGNTIVATGLGPDMSGSREKLVSQIEDQGLEDDLRELVADVWNGIEKACVVKRKERYS